MAETCEWLEDRCQRPAAGDAAHPIHGVIKICGHHVQMFDVPLIQTSETGSAS